MFVVCLMIMTGSFIGELLTATSSLKRNSRVKAMHKEPQGSIIR